MVPRLLCVPRLSLAPVSTTHTHVTIGGFVEMRRHRRSDPSPRFRIKMKGPVGKTSRLILHDTRNGNDMMWMFGVPRTCGLCCIKLFTSDVGDNVRVILHHCQLEE